MSSYLGIVSLMAQDDLTWEWLCDKHVCIRKGACIRHDLCGNGPFGTKEDGRCENGNLWLQRFSKHVWEWAFGFQADCRYIKERKL